MSTAAQIRSAIAALVEAVSGMSETSHAPTELPPGIGHFTVRPVQIGGLGRRAIANTYVQLDFTIDLSFVVAPSPAAQFGHVLDTVQRIEAALLADIDPSVDARIILGGSSYEYGAPGFLDVTMPVSADAILTTPA